VYSAVGPIRVGAAFVDRTRCLPWALDRPCLVCQELCPVSPKAIFTRTTFEPLRDGQSLPARVVGTVGGTAVEFAAPLSVSVNLASGDYYLRPTGQSEASVRRIVGVSGLRMSLESAWPATVAPNSVNFAPVVLVDVVVRLQRPYVDVARCVGCGMCEHECPVSGLRAIRVTSENESRSRSGRMLI
jgi:ferredoxin